MCWKIIITWFWTECVLILKFLFWLQAIHEELEALGRRIRSKKKSSLTKIQNLSYKSLRSVEDRWSQLYLRSIEWEVCIEQLLGSHKRLKLLNVSEFLIQYLSLSK